MRSGVLEWHVGYLVGTAVAVIGLYIAYGVPIILLAARARTFEPAPGTRQALQVDRRIAMLWIVLI